MAEANDRPQDAGRRHRGRLGELTPETAAVLERYRGAMRAELDDVLGEVRPPGAQLTIGGSEERIRPALADRVKLWDLAIKLGRELAAPGAAGDDPDPPAPSPASRTTSGRAPRLSARERRALAGG